MIVNHMIQLRSGRMFSLTDPKTDDIEIEDIAYALARLCRFTGHTTQFYSVAQHCLHVSRLVPGAWALEGLLHDASEAFIGDMSTPLKQALGPRVKELEDRIHWVISVRFDVCLPGHKAVKDADLVALSTERRDLMAPGNDHYWAGLPDPDPAKIVPMYPLHAEKAFLERFMELRGDSS
jgi:hypothetical protein